MILKLLFLVGFCTLGQRIYSQLNEDSSKRYNCLKKVYYDNRGNAKTAKRVNKDEIIFYFFMDFSDWVNVKINDSLIFRSKIESDSDIVSTRYTGTSFKYAMTNTLNSIVIYFESERKYLQFTVNKNYPFCSIYVYKQGDCFVTFRKRKIVLK